MIISHCAIAEKHKVYGYALCEAGYVFRQICVYFGKELI